MIDLIDALKIPVPFTSPYSPQLAPVEQVFGFLKKGNIKNY